MPPGISLLPSSEHRLDNQLVLAAYETDRDKDIDAGRQSSYEFIWSWTK